MTYTPEQRTIITRIGTINAQILAMQERHRAEQDALLQRQVTAAEAQVEAGQHLMNGMAALTVAIERTREAIDRARLTMAQSSELETLHRRHSDAWQEFFDSL